MPLQNRVDPKGQLHAVTSRGMFMGNKGHLHNDTKQIVRNFSWNGWIICALQHQGIKRELMAVGEYTELFFLDEATALSAGHRPCGYCLREKYNEFKKTWIGANCEDESQNVNMTDINKINQKERYHRGSKVTFVERMDSLPNGAFIEFELNFYLIYQGAKYLWSFDGYTEKSALSADNVTVLTPKTFISVLASGYEPIYHDSLKAIENE